MSLRLVVIVILLGTVLAGCVTTSNGDDLERMQRNQDAARETAA